MRLTIAKKVYAVSGVFLLIILVGALSGVAALQKTTKSYAEILKGPVVGRQYAQSAKEHFSNAVGCLAALSLSPGKDDKIIGNFGSEIVTAVDNLQELKKLAAPDEIKEIEEAVVKIKAFEELSKKLVAARDQNAGFYQEDIGKRDELESEVRSLLLSIAEAQGKDIRNMTEATETLRKKAASLLIAGTVAGLTIGLVLTVLIIRGIVPPLKKITTVAERIAGGDLRVEIDYDSGDEIGFLAESMNTMVRSFNAMISNTLAATGDVVSTVGMMNEVSEKTADGARKQSEQSTQIATAAGEMTQTITTIARNASIASETSSEAMATAERGKGISEGAVEAVSKVYTSTVELAAMVEKLNGRVGEIGDIVTVIKDIADQTNLLALNAAIEAARAGEQGRGFAVVADEVRKLAERTVKATAEITEKIGAVQSESEKTTNSMSEASDEVTKANEFIRQVGESLNQIVGSVQGVRDQVVQIAAAVEQQSAASEEVSSNTEKTSTVAKKLEEFSQEMMHKVNGLTRVAESLRSSTSGFKTKESGL